MIEEFHQLVREVADIKRRLSQMHRRGRVHEVDQDGGRVRVRFGTDEDGQPILSPWYPITGGNGASRWSLPLAAGEHVMIDSVDGDWEGGEVRRSNHHEEGERPSGSTATNDVYTRGNVRVESKDGQLKFTVGGTVVDITPNGMKVTIGGTTLDVTGSGVKATVGSVVHNIHTGGVSITNGRVEHDELNIGSTHVHRQVQPGGGTSGIPNP